MKKSFFPHLRSMLLYTLLTINFISLKAQNEEKLTGFIAANEFKNWAGAADAKADGGENIKFKFYRNGNAEKYVLEDKEWKQYNGKWSLSKLNNKWIMTVLDKKYRLQPHFAQTDKKERLVMLDQDDFQNGRQVTTFFLHARGYQ